MTFKEEVASEPTVLVDFYADWCGPCRMMNPVLNEMSKTCKVLKVNIDEGEGRELTVKYNIASIPTLMVFKNGELVKTMVGLQTKDTLLKAVQET